MVRMSPRGVYAWLLVLFAVLTVLRAPEVVYPGRFWAEEGATYFREAYTVAPWRVFLAANHGYYSLYNKLACLSAVHFVPLRLAPVVTGIFAFAAQMVPIVLVLYSRMDAFPSVWLRVAACLAVLLVQPNQEIWLNTINSQFFLCVACGVILVSEAPSRLWHVFRMVALGVAGLTGVVSCLLLPFFIVSYARRRSWQRLHEVVVLGFACVVQAVIVLSHDGRPTDLMNFLLLPEVLLIKQWVLPFLGGVIAEDWAGYARQSLGGTVGGAFLSLSPYVVAGGAIALWGRKEAMLLFAASIFVVCLSVVKAAMRATAIGSTYILCLMVRGVIIMHRMSFSCFRC